MAPKLDEYGRDDASLVPLLPAGTTSLRRPNGRLQVPMVKLLELAGTDTRMGRTVGDG